MATLGFQSLKHEISNPGIPILWHEKTYPKMTPAYFLGYVRITLNQIWTFSQGLEKENVFGVHGHKEFRNSENINEYTVNWGTVTF